MVATPAIPALSKRMNQKFEARLGCMARPYLDKTKWKEAGGEGKSFIIVADDPYLDTVR